VEVGLSAAQGWGEAWSGVAKTEEPSVAVESRIIQCDQGHMSGYVFVCGSTAMGTGVLDALSDILDGGKDAVESLRKEGRIVAEMWG